MKFEAMNFVAMKFAAMPKMSFEPLCIDFEVQEIF